MRKIVIEDEGDRLVLGTVELDGYINLPLNNNKADISRLDDNTCQKTFDCSANELCDYIQKKGY